MSWDLFLIRFRNGNNEAFHPALARAVIERHTGGAVVAPSNPFECNLADGLCVELWARGLGGSEPITGPMLSLRGYTERAAAFIYDLAESADMTILNTGDPVVILTSPAQREQLPPELRDDYRDKTVVVDSAASLHAALSGGFEGWRRYRDHVVNGQQGPTNIRG